MAGFFDDLTFGTPEQAAARAQREFERAEGERRTVAELLVARGHRQAAALVALSSLDSLCVDNWDGGQYEAYLSVPVGLFDRVTGELREQISAAVEVVYGAGHYRGLDVGIRRVDYRDGWDRELFESLTNSAPADSSSDPGWGVLLELPAGEA